MNVRREQVRSRLRELGFDEVRFARVESGIGAGLSAWLSEGYQADMQWMDRSEEKRRDPNQVLSGARSILMLGVNYWKRGSASTDDATRPVWARYALNEDYHDTVKPGLVAAGKVLEEICGLKNEDYRYYVDTGPVLEREWAARSGLGFIGKNAMLISREYGNWLFLAAILCRAEFEPDEPITVADHKGIGLLCGKCTRCLDACPTDAFAAPGVVDARRCISYQTIENKGVIPRELREGIGTRIYGCDVCLDVCPWNRFAQEGRHVLLAARHELADLPIAEILLLTPERFAAVFRRTAIKRVKLAGLLRNACIAAGNSGDSRLLPAVAKLASHESPLVRAHAVWAAKKLGGETLLTEARANETDASVLEEYAAEVARESRG